MSLLIVPSARVRRMAGMIRRKGTDIYLNGKGVEGEDGGTTFRARTYPVADNLTGVRELSVVNLGVLIASADSRCFEISPIYFAPYTTTAPPKERDLIQWHVREDGRSFNYFLSHVTYGDETPDTLLIYCYGFRLIQDLPPL